MKGYPTPRVRRKLSPQVDAYEEKGYDFIAFTDHDYLLKPKSAGLYRDVRSGLILFEGIELTVFVKGYVHVNRIYGEEDELYVLNHLGEYDLSMEQVMDRIETVAGMFPLDAVEVTSKGFRNPEYEIPEIRFPKIASDEAHTRLGIGRAWIELDGPRTKTRSSKYGRGISGTVMCESDHGTRTEAGASGVFLFNNGHVVGHRTVRTGTGDAVGADCSRR